MEEWVESGNDIFLFFHINCRSKVLLELRRDSLHWMGVIGAAWNHPQGLDSEIDEKLDYPAVHISYNDAVEYCAWVGRRLPSEKEWEYAARAGHYNLTYPWGDEFVEGKMNIWEGNDFPKNNILKDGFHGNYVF